MRFSRHLAPILAWALVPLSVVGWIAAQSIPQRLSESSTSTGAWVHMLASSSFAVILGVSAVVLAVIVTGRTPDRPRSLGRRYVTAQIVVLALAVLWLLCILAGDGLQGIELIIAALLVPALVVALAFAVLRDPESSERRAVRLQQRRDARSPGAARAIIIARVVIPVAAVLAIITVILVQQSTVVVHRGCEVGAASVSSGVEILTANCGDFVLDASAADYEALQNADEDATFSGTFDITSRGYAFSPFPKPVAIELVRTGD